MTDESQTEQRRYPRIDIPLLVELKHATLGTHRATAENVSAGGLFVMLPAGVDTTKIKPQAKLKLQLLNAAQIDPQATPTVEMLVARVEEHGLGLTFANNTSQFLWQSTERKRVELAIGRDYFQVHLSALVRRHGVRYDSEKDAAKETQKDTGGRAQADKRLLLVEERGHWVFPGCYLQVGQNWQDEMQALLGDGLGLNDFTPVGPVEIHNQSDPTLPAIATLRVFYEFSVSDGAVEIDEQLPYRDHRWLDNARTLDDLTFANSADRLVTELYFQRLQQPA